MLYKKKKNKGIGRMEVIVSLNSQSPPAPTLGRRGPRAPRQLCHSAPRCGKLGAVQSYIIQKSDSRRVPRSWDRRRGCWRLGVRVMVAGRRGLLAVGHMHPACQPAAFVTLTRTVPHRLPALPHFRAGFLGRGALDGHPRECSPPCHRKEPGL